ncbi:MAG: DedA family protein [Chlorobi bacterium]|nr:DedA family protein [Chlorobiota bacterium]
MIESILHYIGTLDIVWVYVILFFFAFIENVFPPSPSDVVVIIGATLIADHSVGFIPVLFITSIGSALGFILMYYVGFVFGEKVIRMGKLKFISQESLDKADEWFSKYGYYLILANRFLPGTRSVISFFTGLHELNVLKTFVYALISAFLWNLVIVTLGMKLGQNVELIDQYLSAYSTVILAVTGFIIIFFAAKYFIKKKREN